MGYERMRLKRRDNSRKKATGFTLVELMVAVAILAIIAVVAVPLYTQYTFSTYRSVLMNDLMICAQAIERTSAATFTYANLADTNGDGAPDGNNDDIATDICNLESVRTGRYDVTVVSDATTYTLTGTAVAGGPAGGQGQVTLNEQGNRTWDEDSSGTLQAIDLNWEDD